MLQEKLNSVTEHLSNIHHFPDNRTFQQCGHGPLSPEEERGKAWLAPESLVIFSFLEAIVSGFLGSFVCVIWLSYSPIKCFAKLRN